jgi:hypothetical protein
MGAILKGNKAKQMKGIIKDLAHAGISTTVRKKRSRRGTSPKLSIKNQRF